jgi:excisionase family DNA binding protein
MGNERLLVRPEEAAAALSVSRAQIYQWLASGALPSIKLGASRRIEVAELRQYIDRARTADIGGDRQDPELQRIESRCDRTGSLRRNEGCAR